MRLDQDQLKAVDSKVAACPECVQMDVAMGEGRNIPNWITRILSLGVCNSCSSLLLYCKHKLEWGKKDPIAKFPMPHMLSSNS